MIFYFLKHKKPIYMRMFFCLLFLFFFSFIYAAKEEKVKVEDKKTNVLVYLSSAIDDINQEKLESLFISNVLMLNDSFKLTEYNSISNKLAKERIKLEDSLDSNIVKLVEFGIQKLWVVEIDGGFGIYKVRMKSIDCEKAQKEFEEEITAYGVSEIESSIIEMSHRMVAKTTGKRISKEKHISEIDKPLSKSFDLYFSGVGFVNFSEDKFSFLDSAGAFAISLMFKYHSFYVIEPFIDVKFYHGLANKFWNLTGGSGSLGIMLNPISENKSILGFGVGIGIDFPFFYANGDEESYYLSCFNLILPFTFQYGFYISKNASMRFILGVTKVFPANILDAKYSSQYPDVEYVYDKLNNKSYYLPAQLRAFLGNGIYSINLGIQLNFMF